MAGYTLRLEHFEGPLDLLLHLIKVNEIDVFNIDILRLTSQYLEFLRVVEFEDLAHAGEFVEMAAALIEIKSMSLLPKDEHESSSGDEEDDPKQDLQRRLIEYEMFQKASQFFNQLPQLGVEIQTNQEWRRLEPFYEDVMAPLKGDPVSMLVLFERSLSDLAERKPPVRVQAVTHRVGVEVIIEKLENLLKTVRFALFQALFKDFQSRYELVAHILAVLEMSRWGKANIYQENHCGPLWFFLPDFDEGLLPVNRLQRQKVNEIMEVMYDDA